MTGGAANVEPEKFGRYTLLKRIALGGMAEIHLASYEGSDGGKKLAAIKRILPEHGRNGRYVAQLLNEARIAATLNHPNLVRAHDFGCENGTYFLAMEYLRGQDTRRIVQELAQAGRQMPLEVAIAIGIGAATGLHYLHERRDSAGKPLGLVHRDVSPPNLFLTSDGGVKLVDFGIAKPGLRAGDTLTGTVKGRVAYMSPEQSRAEPLDRRTDIFSLSIVLWELTVGRRLFQGVSELQVMNAINKLDVPRPSQMVPRYPPELEQIVVKGLSRDRGRRYETAEQMRADLEAFARAQRLDAAPKSVASFVRAFAEDDHAVVGALEPGAEIDAGSSGGAATARTPIAGRVWLIAGICLLAVSGGLAVLRIARTHRHAPAPAAAPAEPR